MIDSRDLPPDLARTLEEVKRAHVLEVLRACGGKREDAARILGVDRKTLGRWLRRWEIESE